MTDRREQGQAMVETAIVLPLFCFLIFGLLQLGLMQQAKVMAKYAAYRAVRAGALHHADPKRMEEAALAALLPVIADRATSGNAKGAGVYTKTSSAMAWVQSYLIHSFNFMPDAFMPYVEVTICGPLQGDFNGDEVSDGEVDFDDPQITTGDTAKLFGRTKLRIQITFNYRMPIPFADWVIHKAWLGQEIPKVLRMGDGDPMELLKHSADWKYIAAAQNNVFIVPIRTTYAMRMQSNIFWNKFPLPTENKCVH